MADAPIPPDWGTAGAWTLGAAALLKVVADLWKSSAERRKALKEADKAEADEEKAMAEARRANVGTLGDMLLQTRSEMAVLRADLAAEKAKSEVDRASYRRLKSAILEFLDGIGRLIPEMGPTVGAKVQLLLDKLQAASAAIDE